MQLARVTLDSVACSEHNDAQEMDSQMKQTGSPAASHLTNGERGQTSRGNIPMSEGFC